MVVLSCDIVSLSKKYCNHCYYIQKIMLLITKIMYKKHNTCIIVSCTKVEQR